MKNGIKSKKGFSLSELLVCVAILAILAAISIPAIISISRSLKFAELSDTAREIYVSVQNELVGQKASGRLSAVRGEAVDSYGGHSLENLAFTPQDFFSLDDDEEWKSLYYMDSTDRDSFYSYLIGQTSLENTVLDGYFIIEFNPYNGDVYGVFYAEQDFTYDDVMALQSRDSGVLKDHDPMLGYYGGKLDATSVSDLPREFNATVTHVNSEELYLNITCDNLIELIRAQDHLTVTISLTDEHGNQAKKELKGGTDFSIVADKMEFKVLLDSVTVPFAKNIEDNFEAVTGTLTPGDNITADVRVQFSMFSTLIENGNGAIDTMNSLFGDRAEDETGNQINVGYIRHLNNLRGNVYNFTGSGDVTISQYRSMDFLEDNYDWTGNTYSVTAVSPLVSLGPIENTSLQQNAKSLTYDGGGNSLSNFVIAGQDNAGLFGSVNGWAFSDLTFIDPIVTGGNNVGVLAGNMASCTVSGCGAYLSITNADGERYVDQAADDPEAFDNMMEYRRRLYTVTGTGYVGGLIGRAQDTNIQDSYAAVNAVGEGHVGGFAGYLSGGSITRSYSSGDAAAGDGEYAGGIAGEAQNLTASSCYSTSDVIAGRRAGGFVGSMSGGTYTSCVSYGKVCREDGTITNGNAGGFVGNRSGGASCNRCQYLEQKGYNAYSSSGGSGITAKNYEQLALDEPKLDSQPYNVNLYNTVFPFASLEGQTVHHGDWPMQYTVLVALTYYERYTDGDYGLYAVTSLSTGETQSGTSSTDDTRWVLDTLRNDEICVEDGYAVMSVFQLSKFGYKLNGGSEKQITVAKSAGSGKAVLLDTEEKLEFCEYTEEGTVNKSNKFEAKGLYVYQLPFALQDTARNTTAAFFDTLNLTEAFATGNTTTPVVRDYVFYYNPHFSRNAINPDPYGNNEPKRPDDPTDVYVRSARQLNAIGRYYYYWNEGNNPGSNKFDFTQEIDIDFSIYVKKYCGATFNLMSTAAGNAYRNRPIGKPQRATVNGHTIQNFRNNYDGQGHKIIDYCVESFDSDDDQFVGLFGEVRDSTLKNIVIEASDPESGSGYVRSYYSKTGQSAAGVGALAGLIYRDYESDHTIVDNCAVTGYTVSYNGGIHAGVGGLVGFNMDTVRNSSAVSKSVTATPTSGSARMTLGGLVGVNQLTIANCYSGGNIGIVRGSADISTESSIGGITGKVYAIYSGPTHTVATVTNSYSYCAPGTENSGSITYYGVGYAGSNLVGNGFCDRQNITGCYYLNETINTSLVLADADYRGVDGCSYAQLHDLRLSGFGRATAANSHPWSTQHEAYPFPAIVKNRAGEPVHYGNWPLETVPGGYLVYYEQYSDGSFGSFYVDASGVTHDSLDYNDRHDITDAGYGYLTTAAMPRASIAVGVGDETITVTGEPISGLTVKETYSLVSGGSVSVAFDRLYRLPAAAIAAMTPTAATGSADVRVLAGSRGYDKNGLSENFSTSRLYVNAGFAAAISPRESRLGLVQNLQVRTQEHLAAITPLAFGLPEAYIGIDQTHSFTVTDGNAGGVTLAGFYTYNGGGKTITGLRQPLFAQNNGLITNVRAVSSGISGGSAVGALAVYNSGTITDSTVTNPYITADSDAAGFVYSNNGTIENCDVISTGSTGATIVCSSGSAAGFAVINGSGSTIVNCSARVYTVGNQYDGTAASGFIHQNSGSITNCSADCIYEIHGRGSASGFAYSCTGGGSITGSTVSLGQSASITAVFGNAAGFIDTCTGRAVISGCSVTGAASSKIAAGDGTAAGFVNQLGTGSRYDTQITGCSVSNISIVSAQGAGFASGVSGYGALTNDQVIAVSIDAAVSGAGFVLTNVSSASQAISGCTVQGGSVKAPSAAGFAGANSGGISGGGVSGTTVDGNRAAGFVSENSATGAITGGTVTGGVINGTDSASGFFEVNRGVISTSASGAAAVTASSAESGAASGFGHTNSGTVTGSGAAATVTGPRGCGFIYDNTGSVTGSNVTGGSISCGLSAAGFVYNNGGSVTGSGVGAVQVGLTGENLTGVSAGFVRDNSGSITNSTVTGATVSAQTAAAGFAYTIAKGGTAGGCTVSGANITASASAAGFAGINAGAVTGCNVTASQISGATAAGFATENSGSISGSGAYSASGYTGLNITATTAGAGFVNTNTGDVTASFSCGTVSGETAAGFANGGGSINGCFANCNVSGNAAVGFAVSGTISNCYVQGSVTGTASASGFTSGGACQSCYTAASVSGGAASGFGGTAVNCYWVQQIPDPEAEIPLAPFNAGVTDSNGAMALTFEELSMLNPQSLGGAWSYGSGYPYPKLSIAHHGSWNG